jgi:hypothetical protein
LAVDNTPRGVALLIFSLFVRPRGFSRLKWHINSERLSRQVRFVQSDLSPSISWQPDPSRNRGKRIQTYRKTTKEDVEDGRRRIEDGDRSMFLFLGGQTLASRTVLDPNVAVIKPRRICYKHVLARVWLMCPASCPSRNPVGAVGLRTRYTSKLVQLIILIYLSHVQYTIIFQPPRSRRALSPRLTSASATMPNQ